MGNGILSDRIDLELKTAEIFLNISEYFCIFLSVTFFFKTADLIDSWHCIELYSISRWIQWDFIH